MNLKNCSYGGWDNCLELSDGKVRLVITLDVGPRVIFYGFRDGQNLFRNFEDQLGLTGGDEWRNYGGHRLWHAPEVMPRTYFPDNAPVDYTWDGAKLTLDCPPEPDNKLKKFIEISLNENTGEVELSHKIFNIGYWEVELSAWCLSVMAPGGRAIIPQEPYVRHGTNGGESLAPARPLVLWQYTKMADPRFIWGDKYIQLKEDSSRPSKQKIGLLNKPGWAAYALNGDLFLKKQGYCADAVYPDYNCNAEFFTMPGFLEMETLSPLKRIVPGAYVENCETWQLFKLRVGEAEAEIDAKLLPLT
ncbi:MAG: hypothetical protein PHV59_00210 [Victivallales bacterium]|nr:hypothetical protein [Victivallales bacterium]